MFSQANKRTFILISICKSCVFTIPFPHKKVTVLPQKEGIISTIGVSEKMARKITNLTISIINYISYLILSLDM